MRCAGLDGDRIPEGAEVRTATHLMLSRVAIQMAIEQLEQYAATTDEPSHASVHAADLLDTASALLAGAPLSAND